ncbi:GxxExxY protein [Patescibacteria group bacterium]|nr:MAG: GxxExxY protein [Patescibacteria group bacterium]
MTEKSASKLLYPELSYKIVGALFAVHKDLGNTYQEKYYQRAVVPAFDKIGVPYSEQVPIELHFKSASIGRYFVDFLIDGKIILEIKVVPRLTVQHYRQVDAYLKAMKKELGIIANFRSQSLIFRRILNPMYPGRIRENPE